MRKKSRRRGNPLPFYIIIGVAIVIVAAIIITVTAIAGGATQTAAQSTAQQQPSANPVSDTASSVTTTATATTQSKTTATQKQTSATQSKTAATTKKQTSTTAKGSYAVSDDVARGNLVLVNTEHLYSFPSVARTELKNLPNCVMRYTEMYFNDECLPSLKSMMAGYAKAYPKMSKGICSAYRTYEFQKFNFSRGVEKNGSYEKALKWYALPGASEHHTGYAFDFDVGSFDGTGSEAWFTQNSYKYGFVVRYTSDKKSITKINPEPWHFRYVSIPHAYYLKTNGICLEEYIEKLYGYSDSNRLTFSYGGNSYGVYYVKGSSKSDIAAPSGSYKSYEVSGNNIDGFIVTVKS